MRGEPVALTGSCGPKALDLPPEAFGVLRYLAERPGQLVSKEELLHGIWPDILKP
jgi:DNA-binding winged helix-turn-helix (wHTH) protein